ARFVDAEDSMKKSLLLVLACSVWMTGSVVVAQGGDETPMDLEVLPKTWSRRQVGALMQSFNTSLGVECSHCHAEDPDAPPPLPGRNPRLDYALNTKPEKEIARHMLKLTMDLNAQARQPGDDPSVEKISCYTCHRGKATPDKEPEGGWGRGSFSL